MLRQSLDVAVPMESVLRAHTDYLTMLGIPKQLINLKVAGVIIIMLPIKPFHDKPTKTSYYQGPTMV